LKTRLVTTAKRSLAEMSSSFNLRPPRRDELPTLAQVQNAAMASSAVHHLMVPNQSDPKTWRGYYEWTLLRQRARFVNPTLRFLIAEDKATGEVAGLSVWAAQGDCPLLTKWKDETPMWVKVEKALLDAEIKYQRYFTDVRTVVDWEFLERFFAGVVATAKKTPPCLHLWVLVVNPTFQGRGVGKVLLDWGKKLAEEEKLPLFLESNLETPGFYAKMGMKRLGDAKMDTISMPIFAWEYEDGVFLEADGGSEGKYKWKEEISAEKK
jgi:GNAT superfamily N-acetyltransferase